MNPTFKNQKLKFSALIMTFFCVLMFHPDTILHATDSVEVTGFSPNSAFEAPATETNEYFRLVETRIIDARLMDDQMLDDISPALVAPVPVIVSALEIRRRDLQEYNHSVCFKRCHATSDFSASDYTSEQWCRLIENDGHSIFSAIPWENADMKEKLVNYLKGNSKNAMPDSEGIGVWNYNKSSFLVGSTHLEN